MKIVMMSIIIIILTRRIRRRGNKVEKETWLVIREHLTRWSPLWPDNKNERLRKKLSFTLSKEMWPVRALWTKQPLPGKGDSTNLIGASLTFSMKCFTLSLMFLSWSSKLLDDDNINKWIKKDCFLSHEILDLDNQCIQQGRMIDRPPHRSPAYADDRVIHVGMFRFRIPEVT